MRNFILLFFFCFFFCQTTYANLRLDIAIVNKKGIDKGLVLVNELHSSEEVTGMRPAVLVMKDNLRFEITAVLVPDYGRYGPSSLVKISGRILDAAGSIVKDFSRNSQFVNLGKTSKFIFGHEEIGQSIEVSVTPNFIY